MRLSGILQSSRDRSAIAVLLLFALTSGAGACSLGEHATVTMKTNEKDRLPYVWINPGRFEMGCSIVPQFIGWVGVRCVLE